VVELRHEELLLRPPTLADVRAIVAACADPEIARFIPTVPSPYSERDGRAYVELAGELWAAGVSFPFVVVDAECGTFLGAAGVRAGDRPTVGYWLAPEARGRGVATRAVDALVRWVRAEHGVGRIQLLTHPDNVASQRVAVRAGFRRTGTVAHEPPFRDGVREAVVFENP
jgi:RimJ/RimL family protein N-acetyltransferase